jgi:hypothetical protein
MRELHGVAQASSARSGGSCAASASSCPNRRRPGCALGAEAISAREVGRVVEAPRAPVHQRRADHRPHGAAATWVSIALRKSGPARWR